MASACVAGSDAYHLRADAVLGSAGDSRDHPGQSERQVSKVFKRPDGGHSDPWGTRLGAKEPSDIQP